jgi:hypothetical protein
MSGARQAVVAAMICLLAAASLRGQDGTLQTIRDDVRVGAPTDTSTPSPPPPSTPHDNPRHCDSSGHTDSDPDLDAMKGQLILAGVYVAGFTVTSPIWLPMVVMDDSLGQQGAFPGFPYRNSSGYITNAPTASTRGWAGRFDVEYVASFDQVDKIGGHLLLETASRFGLDMRAQHLEERLATGGRDQLWLGDCNLTFRFAQSNWGQFRTGLGLNWLTDDRQTDVGFNFIYGADFVPRQPWVLSATLDAGTLGRAALFRFQATVGAMVNRFEFYTGYEYTDIQRTHWNGLIGGVRLWF